jgi:ribosomal protein L11 methyltransferase
VGELLESVFGTPPVAWHDERTDRTVVSAYVEKTGAWSPEARRQIEAGLSGVRQCGLAPGGIRIQATRLRREDWAESWKRHFRAMEFGRALLVKPSWIRRQPRAGQQVVVLDPGLSFGTGQHPTTGFCLEQIVAGRKPGVAQSLLDIGTGSGILAIAAVKLGYRPVEAYDFDPDAVRVARANARQNGIARRLQIAQRDLTREPLRSVQKFDMVCANLILDLLLSERIRIVNRVCPDGTLMLAGILRKQFPAVVRAYGRLGFLLKARRQEKEWQSGVFVRT